MIPSSQADLILGGHFKRGLVQHPFRGTEIRSFVDVARHTARAIAGQPVPFERIYLLDAVQDPAPEAFEGEVVI